MKVDLKTYYDRPKSKIINENEIEVGKEERLIMIDQNPK